MAHLIENAAAGSIRLSAAALDATHQHVRAAERNGWRIGKQRSPQAERSRRPPIGRRAVHSIEMNAGHLE